MNGDMKFTTAGEMMSDNDDNSFLITITTVNKKSCGLDEIWEVDDEYGNTYEVKVDQGFRWGTFTLRIPEELFKSIDWENTTDTLNFDEDPDYYIEDHSMTDGCWNDVEVVGEIIVKPEYFEKDETEEDVRDRIEDYILEDYYTGNDTYSNMWAIGPFELEVIEAPDWYWREQNPEDYEDE